jgi:hypothetical protein
LGLPALVLIVTLVRRHLGWKRAVALLSIALVLFAAEGARSLPEFGIGLLAVTVAAAVLVFVFVYLFRDNDLAYLLAFVGGRGIAAVAPWFGQPAPGAVATGAIAGALLAATLALVVWRVGRGGSGGRELTT